MILRRVTCVERQSTILPVSGASVVDTLFATITLTIRGEVTKQRRTI